MAFQHFSHLQLCSCFFAGTVPRAEGCHQFNPLDAVCIESGKLTLIGLLSKSFLRFL
jgi:hypothetical protein